MARIEGGPTPKLTSSTSSTQAADNAGTPASPAARVLQDPLFQRFAGATPTASPETVRDSRRVAQLSIHDEMRLIREASQKAQAKRGLSEEGGAAGAAAGAAPAADAGFPYPEGFQKVNADQLRRIMPNASEANVQRYLEPLNQAMAQHDINTPARQQAFLAQVAHESGQLNFSEEIASGRAYEGRRDLGNTQRGDGERYKGRGLIQLTGRANYAEMSEAFGRDLVGNPKQVADDPFLSARVAAHFFQSRGLNELADQRDFLAVTKRINGGTNGLRDREEFYEQAQSVIT